MYISMQRRRKTTEDYITFFFFNISIFLTFVALTSSDYTESDNSSGDFRLKKTVYNNRTRLLIVAGLEGTGHHAISAMLEICRKRKPPLCEADKVLSNKLMVFDKKRRVTNGLFGGSDTVGALKMSLDIQAYMQRLGNRPGNHLFFVGLLESEPANGMFSYPNCDGRFKSLDHPDIYQLAIIAEKANIDLRILVLQVHTLTFSVLTTDVHTIYI